MENFWTILELLAGVLFGLLLIAYGVAGITNPKKWGSMTLNDRVLKGFYGERLYYFLLQYIGAPLCILIGIMWIVGMIETFSLPS